MKWIKLVLISVIVFFFIFTFFSLLIPSHIRLAKAVNMAVPGDSVIIFVSDIKSWPSWNPLLQNASPAQWTLNDSTWENDGMKISLSEIKMNEVTAVITKPGKKSVGIGWRVIDAPGMDSVAVQWYMDFHLRWYPWEKFTSLFFEKIYGTQMEAGLRKMKEMLEDRSSQN